MSGELQRGGWVREGPQGGCRVSFCRGAGEVASRGRGRGGHQIRRWFSYPGGGGGGGGAPRGYQVGHELAGG